MFDGPWGGFLGLIVFIFLTYLGLKHEQRNKSSGEKERERYSPEEIEARSKQRYEDEKILEEEYKKKIIREYKRKMKAKEKKKNKKKTT